MDMKSDAVAKLTIEVEKPLGELLECLRMGYQEVGERHSTRKPKNEIGIENAVSDENMVRIVKRLGAKKAVRHGFKILFDYGGVGGLKDFHISDDSWDIELTAYYTLIAENPQFRPNDRLDAFAIECWCEMRGMSEEESERFVRWNSARKWNIGEGSTVNEIVELWMEDMRM